MIALAVLAVFCVTLIFTGMFRDFASKKGLIDIPGDRTSHTAPTPRGGGVVFVAVTGAASAFLYRYGYISSAEATLVACSFLMAIVGMADDYLKLRNSIRFVAQVVIAGIFLALNGVPETLSLAPLTLPLGLFAWPLCLLFIVWSVNLFNFMDGLDAFATMEAFVLFSVLGALGVTAGAAPFSTLMLILAASMAGFLKWNFPPAKIFMGDGGSYFLGFMIAGTALAANTRLGIPLMVPIILYGLFWFDATVTLIRRMVAGEKWYTGHRSHAYQRLHQAGRSHLTVARHALVVNIVLALLAAAGFFHPEYLLALFAAAVGLLAGLYAAVERIKPFGH